MAVSLSAGTHKRRTLGEHRYNAKDIALPLELDPPSLIDENQAVDLILEAGQISLHDVYLIHGSKANHSANPGTA